MRLPRLTTRRLMVLVAVAALLLYFGQVRRHRQTLALMCGIADRGVRHTGATYRLDRASERVHTVDPGPGTRARTPAEKEDRRRRSAYWVALKQQYERAARYPWLPVAPEPPPPE